MDSLANVPFAALVGAGLLGFLCGCVLLLLWRIGTRRDKEKRIAALCDQLDNKDFKLEALRVELDEMRRSLCASQFDGQTSAAAGVLTNMTLNSLDRFALRRDQNRAADEALMLEGNDDLSYLARRVRNFPSVDPLL